MMTRSSYIVLVDDDGDDRDLFIEGFQSVHPEISVKTFDDGARFMEYLVDRSLLDFPSFVLLDYKMTSMGGAEVLRVLAADRKYDRIPRAVWSTSERSRELTECKKFGACEYFIKPATDKDLQDIIHSISSICTKPGGMVFAKVGRNPSSELSTD